MEQARQWAEEPAVFDGAGLQQELNALPQFVTEIDGESIHFVHVRSDRADAVGLLLLHGWPGTVVELIDLIEPLTAPSSPDDPAYHVLIPSHPGTGLSGPTRQPSWGVDRTARADASLMSELGYGSYFVQGGDHGAVLAPHLGRVDTAHVLGVHVNAASLGFIPMVPVDEATIAAMTDIERHRLQLINAFMTDGNAYNLMQATRPQAIGYGLEDSPIILLSWIVEKVEAWIHSPQVLADPHYRGRQLAGVLISWLTGIATSTANNVYAEYRSLFGDPASFANSGVPTAVITYAEDPSIRQFAEQTNTIVRWTDREDGGHFAALEQPASLLDDLRSFTGTLLSGS